MKKFLLTLAVSVIAITSTATRLVVFSDIHVTPGNPCDSALRVAVATVNSLDGVDLVVVDGDLTNEGSDEQLLHVKSILDQINKPLCVLPGNHENTWSQSAGKTFPTLWGNDRFACTLPDDSLLVVGINCGPYMKMGDGHIKQEDLHWLNKTLEKSLVPGMRVVSFNHYPINDDLDNASDYAQLLARFPVIFHVNGHYHQWQKYRSEGMVLPCITVRALEMKNGHEPRFGFAIFDIDGDKVTVSEMSADGSSQNVRYTFDGGKNRVFVEETIPVPEQYDKGDWKINRVWTDSASIFSRTAADAANIYFTTSTGDVRAIDKTTNQLAWQHIDGKLSLFGRPTLAAGTLFVPTVDHGIIMLDPATGRNLGAIETNRLPIVADGIVTDDTYYQGGMKAMTAIDPATRSIKWQLDSLIGNYCQATPACDGKDLVFGAWDTNLYCVDAKTGQLNWHWNNGKDVNLFSPGNVVPILLDDRVVIVAPDRYMTAIDRKTGKTIWRDNSVKYRESLGVSPDGTTAYAKTMDGELIAVDITGPSWDRRWIVKLGIGYDHAPCAVAVDPSTGIVLTGSRRGWLTAVDPTTRQVVWRVRVGCSEVNGIDIDPTTGDLYLSLIEGTVWRISKER